MDYVKLTEILIKSFLPRVIGHGGKTINAVRTILKASSSLHDRKYINLNVESF